MSPLLSAMAEGCRGSPRVAEGAVGAGAPEAQAGRTSSRSSQVRRPRSSRRLATRLIGMGRHFIHTSLFSSDCARGGEAGAVIAGRVPGGRRVGGRGPRHARCRRARCRRSAGPPAPAPTPRRRPARRGRGVRGERRCTRALGRPPRPGPASHLLARRPLLRGLLLGHRDQVGAAKGARPSLVRAWRGAGRGWRVRGEAWASAQHRDHVVHRLAVARGLGHLLEVEVLPRHARAARG